MAAFVHFAGGISFSASAESLDALLQQLAPYVRERCDLVLWPVTARCVRKLLDKGSLTEAITLYFDHTGARWERERLELVTMRHEACETPEAEQHADERR